MSFINIYYSLQSKNSISLEVGEETKFLPDSAFENSLCTRAYKPKLEKKMFTLPPMPLETELQSKVDPKGSKVVPSMPRNLEKVQNYPQLVKWATIFRANRVILLLQVSSLPLNNLCYILSDL